MIEKIISGGQTGADRAGLDFAIHKGIAHGGWIPRGRITEEGPLDKKYKLKETKTAHYDERTEINIMESDATLLFCHGELSGGSFYTFMLAEKNRKPVLVIDLNLQNFDLLSVDKVKEWLQQNNVKILNIAGPRASKDPQIYTGVFNYLNILLNE